MPKGGTGDLIRWVNSIKTPLTLFGLGFGVYFFSNPTPLDWYKHYVYLAQAFLEGRADLQGLPDFYHDVIFFQDKVYFPNPPLPAILLMPAVALWGTGTDEVRISMLLGAANVVLAWVLLGRLGLSQPLRLLLTILFGFGTVHYSAVILGTSWFLAHVVATTFLLLSLIEFFGQRRPFLLGLLVGLAALSRFPAILGAFFFLLLFLERKGFPWRKAFLLAAGLALPMAFQGYYNWARFGNPLETGYLIQNYYSSVQAEDIARYGFFNLHYIPRHLYILLGKPPDYLGSFPFFRPSPEGMSLFLTTPAVLYALRARMREKVNAAAALTVLAILSPSLVYVATGWVQFGYRYSLDFWPFLLLLIAAGMGSKMSIGRVALVGLSVLVNVWGVYWSVKLGW